MQSFFPSVTDGITRKNKDMANVNIENHRKRQKAMFFYATCLDTNFMRNVTVSTFSFSGNPVFVTSD